ncbi:type III-A CRISPR-associated protein Cas10/Csm1 [Acidithiobacillus caldus]|uniref:type III-A CRISPR-associated protein Cas10/Csm1 n=2 Tax=Acidithiobacillus caldus TaxID=33059 RepID=UPI000AFC2B5A|nr:type III-A CRISPR-associated protein Cas10/Csm1 [Acidithiobacillus caldus]
MNETPLLDASCRVALAAFLHDLGKFAERARIAEAFTKDADGNTRKALNEALYCPQFQGRVTHVHAAFTAIAMDLLEPHLPELVGMDMDPFAAWKRADTDDSLINAAAKHHRPETFLQWVVAMADRLASGFEREEFADYNAAEEEPKNHYRVRQSTLFAGIRLAESAHATQEWCYPLRPFSVAAMFPGPKDTLEPADQKAAQEAYRQLWEQFASALEAIPRKHRQHLPLWLDHFDTLWQTFAQAIPSATVGKVRPDVSLYDHSKTTAALAVALWRYHHDLGHEPDRVRESLRAAWDIQRQDGDGAQAWEEETFLLVQGDFFGIQNFLFAEGGEAARRAAKLLRGRSFYVALLTDLAALKVLDALQLPATSQIINAAGKFLIVAPNTPAVVEKLSELQRELDAWFLEHTLGQSNIGLAWTPACARDFRRQEGEQSPFRSLMDRLFATLEERKMQRFDLCGQAAPAPIFTDYLTRFAHGACAIDGRSPATRELAGEEGIWVSDLSHDQVSIGKYLTNKDRIVVTRQPLAAFGGTEGLLLPIFGWHLYFTGGEEETGKFGAAAQSGQVVRLWDFSLPEADPNQALWNGYARRYINAYIPRFGTPNELERQRYDTPDAQNPRAFQSFEDIARADQRWDPEKEEYVGIEALMTCKGDVDNLGQIFQRGLEQPTFAKMASLSRQMNAFFAVYLPYLCRTEFPQTYTVFAGGDDFFLIGPWRQSIRLARQMRERFSAYVAENPGIHFSAGMLMSKPGIPIRQMARQAESALDEAKHHHPKGHARPPKNQVTLWNTVISWDDLSRLMDRSERLGTLQEQYKLSGGYVYGLLSLVDMAAEEYRGGRPEAALWHSRFSYQTYRAVERAIENKGSLNDTLQKRKNAFAVLSSEIYEGMSHYRERYRIPIFYHLYQQRDA